MDRCVTGDADVFGQKNGTGRIPTAYPNPPDGVNIRGLAHRGITQIVMLSGLAAGHRCRRPIELDPDDPILIALKIGDWVRCEGSAGEDGDVTIIIAPMVVIINVNIYINTRGPAVSRFRCGAATNFAINCP